jgi:hypothetical protein
MKLVAEIGTGVVYPMTPAFFETYGSPYLVHVNVDDELVFCMRDFPDVRVEPGFSLAKRDEYFMAYSFMHLPESVDIDVSDL